MKKAATQLQVGRLLSLHPLKTTPHRADARRRPSLFPQGNGRAACGLNHLGAFNRREEP